MKKQDIYPAFFYINYSYFSLQARMLAERDVVRASGLNEI